MRHVGLSEAAMVLAAIAVACRAEPLPPAPGEGGGGAGGAGGQGGAACSPGDGTLYAVDLAAGSDRACAVVNDGSVYCWGVNDFGEAGVSSLERIVRSPSRVGIDCVRSVGIGVDSVCAIRQDNLVHCWGNNDFGQLGHPNVGPIPAEVIGLGAVATLAVGSGTPAALRSDGDVLSWGGSILDPASPHVMWSDVYAVPRTGDASCVVTTERNVLCVGENSLGQLGDGTTTDREQPVQVVGLENAHALALRGNATCARHDEGISCWGQAVLGDGTDDNSTVPVSVVGTNGTELDLTGGSGYWCAVVAGGTVKCWGENGAGRLGSPTPKTALEPIAVPNLPPATAVATGAIHACALVEGGQVYCWGANTRGQLGVPDAGDVSGPIRVRFPFEDP